ncbi:unnamed protein product [Triticum turgidum subsp. durum]|uniref:RNase III domain-containing protein n=1 Tax=Triticum turgidum subsp. durum TaxID=4567 RepID=A0A9R1Q9R9_TRITD|nr:unnamed protein product [Triticum turgidum subsp. durum]
MATVAATMATPTRHRQFRVRAAWDMNPGAATVAVPKPSKDKPKPALGQSPAAATTPARAPPPTHADLFARSSEDQAKKSTYMGFEKWWLPPAPEVKKPRSLYNKRVMDVVKCESQDLLLNKLLGEDFLTEEERDILRWGRNIVSSKTRTRKRAGIAVYNRASSLETLIGYLYLTNFKRLEQMMFQLGFTSGASSQNIADELLSSFQKTTSTSVQSQQPAKR